MGRGGEGAVRAACVFPQHSPEVTGAYDQGGCLAVCDALRCNTVFCFCSRSACYIGSAAWLHVFFSLFLSPFQGTSGLSCQACVSRYAYSIVWHVLPPFSFFLFCFFL